MDDSALLFGKDETRRWLEPIARELDALHEAGIFHRDVKLSNLLIDSSERVILADFGISKWIQREQANTEELTGRLEIPGTVEFAAPELCDSHKWSEEQAEKYARTADQYSLAASVYRYLCGRFTHEGTGLELLLKKRRTPAPPIGGLPKEAAKVLARALHPKPEERYDTCLEFAQSFLSAWEGRSPPEPIPGPIDLVDRDPISPPNFDGFERQPTGSSCLHTYVHQETGMEFLLVEQAVFPCGSPLEPDRSNDADAYMVDLSLFLLARRPCSWDEWLRWAKGRRSRMPAMNTPSDRSKPVEAVSWDLAKTFCQDLGLHLPTEAQWECAARAGMDANDTRTVGGESVEDRLRRANNPWGFQSMVGRVSQWCRDWYAPFPGPTGPGQAVRDPIGPADGVHRVHRGGPQQGRSATSVVLWRDACTPRTVMPGIGFRPARTLE